MQRKIYKPQDGYCMKRDYLPFEEAREFVRKQALQNSKEWKLWSKGEHPRLDKRPDFIPAAPDVVYHSYGWLGWSDWIGTKIEKEYLPFEEAREYVRSLGLKNAQQWQRYYKGEHQGLIKPDNIPWNPQVVYENDWNGIKDWLGTEWRSFEKARDFARNLGLDGVNQWRRYCQGELAGLDPKPYDIPVDPSTIYKGQGWKNISDWLGTDRKRKGKYDDPGDTWLTFEEAKDFVHKLGLREHEEWQHYVNGNYENLPPKPLDIPRSPHYVYKSEGWSGWVNWLRGAEEDIQHVPVLEKSKDQTFLKKLDMDTVKFDYSQFSQKYKNNATVTQLFKTLKSSKQALSIIEIDLPVNAQDEIETILLGYRTLPSKLTRDEKAFLGLIFLVFLVYALKNKGGYTSIWNSIYQELEKFSKVTTFFRDHYFMSQHNYPNHHLKEAIEYAVHCFKLRNDYSNKDDHQYIRNTIYLQIGLVDSGFKHLKLWLSNCGMPIVLSELYDQESHNYSSEFSNGWRAIKRFRDHVIDLYQAKQLLLSNPWFSHTNIDELLKSAKQKIKQIFISDSNDLPIFYLEKIFYLEGYLQFYIQARDLYTLKLGGLKYEVYIDDEYKGSVIADSNKMLVLDRDIVLKNPDVNKVTLELKNEDEDVVFTSEIVLFDFNEQIMIFDEEGNIYQNIFRKLNTTKRYYLLMDSDLDCNHAKDEQREFFEGYATLVPSIKSTDDCKVLFNGEILFSLNFTETIEKPDWLDKLVVYAASTVFELNQEQKIQTKILTYDEKTDDVHLDALPKEASVVKWNYAGGYADQEDLEGDCITAQLSSDMMIESKHTLFIKYQGKTFKKTLNCVFVEKMPQVRIFLKNKQGKIALLQKNKIVTLNDLQNKQFYICHLQHNEPLYLKSKSYFYQNAKVNRFFSLGELNGFGEMLFYTEHLYNAHMQSMFCYMRTNEYFEVDAKQDNKLHFNPHKTLPESAKILLFDETLKQSELSFSSIKNALQNHVYTHDVSIVCGALIFKDEIIDAFWNMECFDDMKEVNELEKIKILLATNYPFLLKDTFSRILKRAIVADAEEFFKSCFTDHIIIKNKSYKTKFSPLASLFEHICFEIPFSQEVAHSILKHCLAHQKIDLLLQTPIIAFKLLLAANSKKFTEHFLDLLEEPLLEEELDEWFIEKIISDLFSTESIQSIDKHNLKIAMHHISSNYYLVNALRRIV